MWTFQYNSFLLAFLVSYILVTDYGITGVFTKYAQNVKWGTKCSKIDSKKTFAQTVYIVTL